MRSSLHAHCEPFFLPVPVPSPDGRDTGFWFSTGICSKGGRGRGGGTRTFLANSLARKIGRIYIWWGGGREEMCDGDIQSFTHAPLQQSNGNNKSTYLWISNLEII